MIDMISQTDGKSRAISKNHPNFLKMFCEHSLKNRRSRRPSTVLWKTLWKRWKPLGETGFACRAGGRGAAQGRTRAAAPVFEFGFEFADADAVVIASASAFVYVIVSVYGYRPHALGCGRIPTHQYL